MLPPPPSSSKPHYSLQTSTAARWVAHLTDRRSSTTSEAALIMHAVITKVPGALSMGLSSDPEPCPMYQGTHLFPSHLPCNSRKRSIFPPPLLELVHFHYCGNLSVAYSAYPYPYQGQASAAGTGRDCPRRTKEARLTADWTSAIPATAREAGEARKM